MAVRELQKFRQLSDQLKSTEMKKKKVVERATIHCHVFEG